MSVFARFLFIVSVSFLHQCAFVQALKKGENVGSDSDKELGPEGKKAVAGPPSMSMKDMEVKTAKMWARLDELEEEIYQQRQKIQILEKSQMLGLTPEDLKPDESETRRQRKGAKNSIDGMSMKRKSPPRAGNPEEKGLVEKKPKPALELDDGAENGGSAKVAIGEKQNDNEESGQAEKTDGAAEPPPEFQEGLAKAQENFQSGNYSRAIVELASLKDQFGPNVAGGVHIFWIGRSWAKMKEFQLAADHFTKFIADQPQSPWIGRAKFELARAELQLGMRTKAVARFKEVIQSHPYEDISEMARMQLQNLEKSL